MSDPRANERNDAHVRENLIDPGPLPGVSEEDARAARKALRDSTPSRLRQK